MVIHHLFVFSFNPINPLGTVKREDPSWAEGMET